VHDPSVDHSQYRGDRCREAGFFGSLRDIGEIAQSAKAGTMRISRETGRAVQVMTPVAVAPNDPKMRVKM